MPKPLYLETINSAYSTLLTSTPHKVKDSDEICVNNFRGKILYNILIIIAT